MGLFDFLLLLLIAGIAGSIGQSLGGSSKGGCLISIVLGFIGAFLGMWIARKAGLPTIFVLNIGGTAFPVIWAVIGSALFVAILKLISRA